MSDTPERLIPALRQYRHNAGEGLLAGYDFEETNRAFSEQAQRIVELEALITQFKQTKTTGDQDLLFAAVDGRGASLAHIKADTVESAAFMLQSNKFEQLYSLARQELFFYAASLRNSGEGR